MRLNRVIQRLSKPLSPGLERLLDILGTSTVVSKGLKTLSVPRVESSCPHFRLRQSRLEEHGSSRLYGTVRDLQARQTAPNLPGRERRLKRCIQLASVQYRIQPTLRPMPVHRIRHRNARRQSTPRRGGKSSRSPLGWNRARGAR
jgi:hypothetical protein